MQHKKVTGYCALNHCNKGAPLSDGLDTHVNAVHNYRCAQCGERFTRKESLTSHQTKFNYTMNNTRRTNAPAPKKRISITQTYCLAHKAMVKLSCEAAQSDHDLRLLIGHANMLDSLMLELAETEPNQDRWFNQSVRGTFPQKHHSVTAADKRHMQCADCVEESEDSSSDSEPDGNMATVDVAAAAKLVHLDGTLMAEYDEELVCLARARPLSSHSSSAPDVIDNNPGSCNDESTMPPLTTDSAFKLISKHTTNANTSLFAPRRPTGLSGLRNVSVF